jgi:excisionase family DNA binding protein
VLPRDSDALLTSAQIATQLDVPLATVRQWLWDGQLRGHRGGGSSAGWRVRAADLDAFLVQLSAAASAR